MSFTHVRNVIEEISRPQLSLKKIQDREAICLKVNNWISEETPLLCQFHLHAEPFCHSSGYDFEVLQMKVCDGHYHVHTKEVGWVQMAFFETIVDAFGNVICHGDDESGILEIPEGFESGVLAETVTYASEVFPW